MKTESSTERWLLAMITGPVAGTFSTGNASLARLYPYVAEILDVEIQRGRADFAASFEQGEAVAVEVFEALDAAEVGGPRDAVEGAAAAEEVEVVARASVDVAVTIDVAAVLPRKRRDR